MCSWGPSSSTILSDIERIMGFTKVHAKQYKLNLYEEGGFFKRHVDTPDPEGMFGTLLVCLPGKHRGTAIQSSGRIG